MEDVCSRLPELVHFCVNLSSIPVSLSKENDRIKVRPGSPAGGQQGNPIGRLTVVYDITQKKRTSRNIRSSRKLAVTEERGSPGTCTIIWRRC